MAQRKIVVLCDNETANPDCGCEWGLSFAIDLGQGEGGEGLWLWDTGQTALFLQNARVLGVDVRAARGLALSHGHYDHTGGLSELLRAGFAGSIHAHPACAADRYAEERNGKPRRPIGPPVPLRNFIPAGPTTTLAPGLTLLTDIARLPGRYQSVAGFSYDSAGTEPDNVPDDSLLVMECAQGPVVILGCCHSGLANALACASQRLGLKQFHAVLGGLHLYNAPPTAIAETAQAIGQYGVRHVVAGHCTGKDRTESLRALLPHCGVDCLAVGQTWRY